MKRKIPVLITSLVGLILLLSTVTSFGRELNLPGIMDNWQLLITAGAFMMGSIGLTKLHITNIVRRKDGWFYSVVLLVALWGFFILGLVETANGPTYQRIFNSTLKHLEATTFSLVAFYIASSAYRAFRVRNIEGTILLVTGAIVMLGSVPIGEAISSLFPVVKTWIMNVPNSAVQRGLQICIRLGSLAVALRVLLSLERAHLGGGSE